LILIQKFVGLKTFLSDPEMEMLIEYITDEFPDFAIDEIDNAVRMAISGRLLGENSKPISEHYNEFGALYLTKILKPYQHYRGSIIRKYNDAVFHLLEEERIKNIPKKTPEEERKATINFCLSAFDNFKNSIPTIGLDRVYDFLASEKKISVTHEKYKQYEEIALQTIKRESKRGNSHAQTILEAINNDESSNASLLAKTKTLAVKAHFIELMELKAELSDHLTE
jgi:hypothetical protein